jgi:hypothetical protein
VFVTTKVSPSGIGLGVGVSERVAVGCTAVDVAELASNGLSVGRSSPGVGVAGGVQAVNIKMQIRVVINRRFMFYSPMGAVLLVDMHLPCALKLPCSLLIILIFQILGNLSTNPV